jgi:hypothetical protein
VARVVSVTLNRTTPGLGFDKVATRIVNRLRANLADAVPPGTTLLVATLPCILVVLLADRV